MSDCKERYYGKYRGTVVNNEDPKRQGRIMVLVPDVSGIALSSWAMPCIPIGGTQSGLFAIPAIEAGVWVEFEQGDPDYPIWSGGFWGSAADPPMSAHMAAPAAPNIVMQTIGQNSITIFGAPPAGITMCAGAIASPTSPKIVITSAGIEISAGTASITILSSGMVMINRNALVVLP